MRAQAVTRWACPVDWVVVIQDDVWDHAVRKTSCHHRIVKRKVVHAAADLDPLPRGVEAHSGERSADVCPYLQQATSDTWWGWSCEAIVSRWRLRRCAALHRNGKRSGCEAWGYGYRVLTHRCVLRCTAMGINQTRQTERREKLIDLPHRLRWCNAPPLCTASCSNVGAHVHVRVRVPNTQRARCVTCQHRARISIHIKSLGN